MLDYYNGVAAVTEPVNYADELRYVLGMKSRSRLVKYIYSLTRRALRKLGSELNSLCLSARKGRRGLTDFYISQSYVEEGLELTLNLRYSVKEGYSLLYRHFKHVVYALSLILNVKGIAVVSSAAADVTLHVNVGKEVHLNALYTVTLTRLTSSAAHVKGKSARIVALCLGVFGLGKKIAYICEESRIGCGVRARCSSNRALVNVDNLIEILESLDSVDLAGLGYRAIKLLCQSSIQNSVDERGLSAARNTGNRH